MSKAFSLFAAALLLVSQVTNAQIQQLVYPGCPTSWSWSFNSLGQSPCAVAAHLQGACNNGVFTIPNLEPGNSYTGPTGPGDENDLCKCNTVVYSLMSACDACQGAKWFSWKSWSRNCTAVDPPTTFSNLIPSGTRVQEWAFIDVTDEGTWDPVLAYQVGDATEVNAGQPGTLAAPATPTTTQTAVPGLASTLVPASHNGSSAKKIGAIIGGVLGGLAFIAATVALLLWRARIRRRTATRAAAAAMFPGRTALPLQEKLGKKEETAAVEPVGAEAI
ncbi:hypothetical protein H4582DRAFT_1917847 [Lactarius indigo]|nr:hypothetical protein H4582DRAFT_1917847 [Lactarius indigo]